MTTNPEWYPGMPESADEARDRHETAVAYCKCMNLGGTCPNRHYDESRPPVVAPDRSTVVAAEPCPGAQTNCEPFPEPRFHPAVLGILRFFDYHHLRPELQTVSQPFHDLAHQLAATLPPDPETTVALRKLREAKDIAVSLVAIGLPR